MSQVSLGQALQQAYQLQAAGRLGETEALCLQILRFDPQNGEALHLLGVVAQQAGNLPVSEEYLKRSLQASPFAANTYNTYGETLRLMGRGEEAVRAYQGALARNPRMAQAWSNMGLVLQEMGKLTEAEDAYHRAIELSPHFADARSHLACLLNSQERREEALAAVAQAVEINPGFAAGWNNYGVILETAGRLEEAIEAYGRAAQLNPGLAEAFHNRGVPLVRLNRLEEAKASWEQALALRPNLADAHFNIGLVLLLEGRFQEGWKEHEWRWKVPKLQAKRIFSQGEWDGSALGGKTILLHPEQGFGDSIQFMRFAPLVAARGGRVVLEVQGELVELAKSLPQVAQVVALNDPLPPFDVQAAMLTIPHLLQTTLETIPAEVPYLRVPEEALARWRTRVETALCGSEDLKVGLVWQGRPSHKDDANRSMGRNQIETLAEVPGVKFFSLQKYTEASSPAAASETPWLIDLTEHIRDFTDTGALIEQLDLVIGVDTSVVHLAGALGRPVWTLLPFAPDWRWLMERTESPWYPTMRLFRQKQRSDWSAVMSEVARELRQLSRRTGA